MIGFPISVNWKGNSYDSIVVIIHQLTKMIHYELVKITINVLSLTKVIINLVIHHYRAPELIIIDQGLLFMSKF